MALRPTPTRRPISSGTVRFAPDGSKPRPRAPTQTDHGSIFHPSRIRPDANPPLFWVRFASRRTGNGATRRPFASVHTWARPHFAVTGTAPQSFFLSTRAVPGWIPTPISTSDPICSLAAGTNPSQLQPQWGSSAARRRTTPMPGPRDNAAARPRHARHRLPPPLRSSLHRRRWRTGGV